MNAVILSLRIDNGHAEGSCCIQSVVDRFAVEVDSGRDGKIQALGPVETARVLNEGIQQRTPFNGEPSSQLHLEQQVEELYRTRLGGRLLRTEVLYADPWCIVDYVSTKCCDERSAVALINGMDEAAAVSIAFTQPCQSSEGILYSVETERKEAPNAEPQTRKSGRLIRCKDNHLQIVLQPASVNMLVL